MSDLVLFDFDGTITYRDTTRDLFIVLARHRPARVILGLPSLLGLILARGDENRVQAAKCRLLGIMLQGLVPDELSLLLARFRDRVLPLLRPRIMDALLAHQRCGAQVLVVTASPRLAVEAVLAFAQIRVIGTEFSQRHGRLSSVLDGVPCHGPAKLAAIKEFLKEQGSRSTVSEAWSDSWSDHPMMNLAIRRIWVVPRKNAQYFRAKDPAAKIIIGD